ncbi:MAG: c-type cytochrome [Alphaproteobacteria bacterium]|nr:c-type cytochrome [Alphaproteobacteria bacterium]
MGHEFPRAFGFAGILALLIGVGTAATYGVQTVSAEFEAGEDRPGGAATSKRSGQNANAFSHSSGNLSFEDEFTFKLGNGIFRKLWVSSPASTKASDGLGPYYNARACQRCHLKDGRGHPPSGPDDTFVSMLFRIGVPASTSEQIAQLKAHQANTFPDANYGGQIQDVAIQGFPSEATPSITYEEHEVELNGGETVSLRKPIYRFSNMAYGPFPQGLMISPRIANQMIGLGLLEAIPDEALRKPADPQDANGDGVSGRVNKVWDVRKKVVRIGRFGWKAGQPTVEQQASAAFLGDMGLSTALFPNSAGDCTRKNERCLAAPHGSDAQAGTPEVTDKMLELVTFYAQNLAVPPRVRAKEKDILKGKALFSSAGCAACHTPRHVTGDRGEIPKAFWGQVIWPHTDLLLHDLGPDLADGFTEGVANGSEWRTPPLWGIGHTKAVSKHTQFLHDGRARNLLEAILWHGGEAEGSRNHMIEMMPAERELLLGYLNSL